ncbi:MAG: 50S ribosomal protein L32 [Candidatus Eisenbacteria bacterium]|jgi:large subunit ribosomal protein L32|nr:50S ribosomal protein L32 [Candidatus Eisenbacteria bacterium]
MAVPKRRHSSTRGKKRRTGWKLKVVGTSKCSNCGAASLAHRVCKACGYYKGEEIVTPREQ